jgi:hypothetical protein
VYVVDMLMHSGEKRVNLKGGRIVKAGPVRHPNGNCHSAF